MTRLQILLLSGLLCAGALAARQAAAQAQPRACAPHAVVVEQLASRFGESRQSVALGSNNALVEMFASTETGSWTLVVTVPGGPTCLVASGHAFELVAEALPNTDPDA